MSGARRRWAIRLAASAEGDIRDIISWTHERFGEKQARAYARVIAEALMELTKGPEALGVKLRPDIGRGIFSFHLARRGHKARHIILFRAFRDDGAIEVLRVLHDAMDIALHLPPEAKD